MSNLNDYIKINISFLQKLPKSNDIVRQPGTSLRRVPGIVLRFVGLTEKRDKYLILLTKIDVTTPFITPTNAHILWIQSWWVQKLWLNTSKTDYTLKLYGEIDHH